MNKHPKIPDEKGLHYVQLIVDGIATDLGYYGELRLGPFLSPEMAGLFSAMVSKGITDSYPKAVVETYLRTGHDYA